MTEPERGPHIPEEELALYTMQGLSTEGVEALQAHLESCADCRSRLENIGETLALLGMSVPQEPLPEGARQRFEARLAQNPKPEPILGLRPAAQAGGLRRHGILFWTPWVATVALAIAVVLLGIENQALDGQLNNQSHLVAKLAAKASRAQQVFEVLTSPSTQHISLMPSGFQGVPMGRAAYLSSEGALIFVGMNLKPLPRGKTYELWLIPASGKPPLPAGLFAPDARGSASIVLPALPPGVPAKAFGVTVEKAGGSRTPTPPILLAGAIPEG